MKKIYCILIAALTCVTLTGCVNKQVSDQIHTVINIFRERNDMALTIVNYSDEEVRQIMRDTLDVISDQLYAEISILLYNSPKSINRALVKLSDDDLRIYNMCIEEYYNVQEIKRSANSPQPQIP